jgi:NADH-quinone oxidoreductase subunit E
MIGSWQKRFAEEAAKKAAAADAAAKAAQTAATAPAAPTAAPAPAPAVQPAPLKQDPTPAAKVPPPLAVAAAGEADQNKVPPTPKDGKTPAAAKPPIPPPPTVAPVEVASPAAKAEAPVLAAKTVPVSDEHKPLFLAAARADGPDDLKLIRGVGPKLEDTLHRMGVFHFDQIATWTQTNLVWVDQNLGTFRGRAVRDGWIEQAKKLGTGWRPEKSAGDKTD